MKFAYGQKGQKLQPFKVISLNFPKKCSAGGEHTQTRHSAQNYTVNGITNCPEELLGFVQLAERPAGRPANLPEKFLIPKIKQI